MSPEPVTTASERLLIVSPVYNESKHLDRTAQAIAAQERRPDRWVIVDDGSSDDTLEIARRWERELDYVTVLSAPQHAGDAGPDRLALAKEARAFNLGLREAGWREFTHIGKLDGDVLLPPDYFERLLERFHEDPGLGVAGGALTEQLAGKWVTVATPPHQATGPARVYSRACLQAIGGVPERMGADTIADTYARMSGFSSRTFTDVPFRHLRPMGSAQGALRGRARHGATQYAVHYNLAWAVLRAGKLALRAGPRPLSGPAFLFGYLRAAAGGTRRVEDPAFRAFMRADQRRRTARVLTRGRR